MHSRTDDTDKFTMVVSGDVRFLAICLGLLLGSIATEPGRACARPSFGGHCRATRARRASWCIRRTARCLPAAVKTRSCDSAIPPARGAARAS